MKIEKLIKLQEDIWIRPSAINLIYPKDETTTCLRLSGSDDPVFTDMSVSEIVEILQPEEIFKTFDEWIKAGRHVHKGSKSTRKDGLCVFSKEQTYVPDKVYPTKDTRPKSPVAGNKDDLRKANALLSLAAEEEPPF
jgi:hypothetical protein